MNTPDREAFNKQILDILTLSSWLPDSIDKVIDLCEERYKSRVIEAVEELRKERENTMLGRAFHHHYVKAINKVKL